MIFTMSVDEAREFALDWLPAWTGNDPELLASFYSNDAFYLDPFVPDGIYGKAAILEYFTKLLAQYPNWIWTQLEAIPMENGFINKWEVTIPSERKLIHCTGVCLVQIIDGEIYRNEMYFDRSALKEAMKVASNVLATYDA